ASPSESDHELADQGWTIDAFQLEGTEEPGVRRVQAEVRFALPAKAVWKVINGESRGNTRWPGFKEAELVWASGDSSISRYHLDVPLYRDRHYELLKVEDQDAMALDFAMVPGYGNVDEIEGRWNVTPVSDTLTYVEYRLDTDPGVDLVPGFIVEWATKNAIPKSFRYVYQRALNLVETGPTLGERIR
ncbi:MAG: hypothetical protein GF346_03770, partial [Candidatus Eisenbacteria bacterium]|nr:hypothetical protein [Candidatus Latescibacterota bacterium]MBD3301542.1 hypothetical protein [Candidatus Eisenbacteria bacterium]